MPVYHSYLTFSKSKRNGNEWLSHRSFNKGRDGMTQLLKYWMKNAMCCQGNQITTREGDVLETRSGHLSCWVIA